MDALSDRTCVRSEMVLTSATALEISCDRSPRRLKRFSVSEIDSRSASIPRTVPSTAVCAACVAVAVLSAVALDVIDSRATSLSCCVARPSVSAIESSDSRSLSAAFSTNFACSCSVPEVRSTSSATLRTSTKVVPISSASWLTDADTVPMMSSVTGARTVRSLLDNRNTPCSNPMAELLMASFSWVALSSAAIRSSSNVSKARPKSPISSFSTSWLRAAESPPATAFTVSESFVMGDKNRRKNSVTAKPATTTTARAINKARSSDEVLSCSIGKLASAWLICATMAHSRP